jgi:DNA helicase-2/ATP-dependent DNA helicase PcrA
VPLPEGISRWTPVERIETEPYAGPVYSLEVEADHTYMANGIVVLNSIYGFRGSSPEYLTEFAEAWKARVYCMNRNYRSGRAVVSLANTIIRPAEVRLPIDLVAERPLDGVVRVRAAATLDDEAEEVANDIAAFVAGGGRYGAAAVLSRTNAQSRAVEDVFVRRGIPYVVLGGCAFYERREVRDLLAYLRLAGGHDLRSDTLRQCLNSPFRFLPAALADRLREASGHTWAERATEAASGAGLKPRQAEAVAEWSAVMDGLARAIGCGARPAELLNDLIGRVRYIEHLERDQGRESIEASPGANVRELVRVAERFDTVDTLLDFVNETLRAVEQARKDADAQDRVLIMSVHRSKGLEWERVWVIGCNEDILPHQRGDLEEERRLLYVASTRARDELTLSHVAAISTRAGTRSGEPSRFLIEAGLVPGADAQEGA